MGESPESDRIATWLKRYGLHEFAAVVIEAAGPFRYLGAQVMYVLQPLLGNGMNFAQDLALILEDGNKVEALLFKLREVNEHND